MKTLLQIKPSDITVRKGFNTREDFGDMRQLTMSMEEKGFDPSEPIIVSKDLATEGKYLLGSQGHRRLASAMKLDKEGKLKDGIVYAIEEEENLSESDRNLDIIRLNTGEPLTMLAIARVMARAQESDKNLSNRELGRRLGFTGAHVDNCMLLLKGTEQTLSWVAQGKVSSTLVVDLLRENKKDAAKVEEVVEKTIKEQGLGTGGTKPKVTKTTVAKIEETTEETPEEKEAREKKEAEEKAEALALKVRNGYLRDVDKRVEKFFATLQEGVVAMNDKIAKGEKADSFQLAIADISVTIGAFIKNIALDSSRLPTEGEATKLSDVWAAIKGAIKAHSEGIKTVKSEMEAEYDAQISLMKEEIKGLKAEIKDLKKAAKA